MSLNASARIAAIAATATTLVLAPTAAIAETGSGDDGRGDAAVSYWNAAFLGGALAPLGTMDGSYQQGLAAGLRVGWTSTLGLGLDLNVDYSPLARRVDDPLERFDIHYGSATLTPRYTLGQNLARIWIAGGGGASFERIRHTLRDTSSSTTSTALVATGAAGAELHIVSGGGLVLIGSYSRLFGSLEHQYAEVIGGLVFSFR